jgi:hypothetical protein
MSGLAYHKDSSPIHRGVFIAKQLLGRRLRQPPSDVKPLTEEFNPKMTTRERVEHQTKETACMNCHTVINPLGFSLENFDAVGRFRVEEKKKPIDVSTVYKTPDGEKVELNGARDLAIFLANNETAQRSFVQQLFHHYAKQSIDTNDNMPELSKMQIDLLINGFTNDLNRIATLQYTRSVGQPKMRWLEVNEGHHGLSHDPDDKKKSQEKLRRINTWYCQQMAYLCKQLEQTKEPGTDQSMLDNTLVIWTNELGHGNSHTLNNLPMVMVGGGFGFEMGRYTKVKDVSTTRLWLALSHAMGHQIDSFGLPKLCKEGPVKL